MPSQDKIEQGDEAPLTKQDEQTDANIALIQETTDVEGDAVVQPPGMSGGRKRISARRGKGKAKRNSRKCKRGSRRH